MTWPVVVDVDAAVVVVTDAASTAAVDAAVVDGT